MGAKTRAFLDVNPDTGAYRKYSELLEAIARGDKAGVAACAKDGIKLSDGMAASLLRVAAEVDGGGGESVVEFLVRNDVCVNAIRKSGRSPLIAAVAEGQAGVVRCLVENGADVAQRDKYSWTALHYAAEKGFLDIVRCLVQNGAPVDCLSGARASPLMLAAQGKHEDVMEYLLGEGARVLDDDAGDTALHVCARKKMARGAELLVNHQASVNEANCKGKTPLHYASTAGCEAVVKTLLGHRADPNETDHQGTTPAHFAASVGLASTLKLLAAHGAALDRKNNRGETPLFRAVREGHQAVARYLISAGADPKTSDAQRNTLVHAAVLSGDLDVISDVVGSLDLNANHANSSGDTPFHALFTSRDPVVQEKTIMYLAEESEPQLDVENDDGETPVDRATREGRLDLLLASVEKGDANRALWAALKNRDLHKFRTLIREGGACPVFRTLFIAHCAREGLLEYLQAAFGAFVARDAWPVYCLDERTVFGETPLTLAVRHGRYHAVEWLLDAGAYVHFPAADGSTALHVAAARGFADIAWLLLAHGGSLSLLNKDGKRAAD
eukprot:gene10466-16113_t